MLQHIAAILKSCIGPYDTAARVGGDEFAILLQACSQERAAELAERILAAIGALRVEWEGRTYQVGASIGIAYTYCGEYNAAATLRAADAACYAAKDAGRGCIRMYHADPQYDASGRFELTQLRAAS
jgi:diguanylate cyclase (GGDEF)-like protein